MVRGRLHHPPTSLSLIGHFGELREIRACARDLPSQADPERDVVGANRPNFANPLCARFPYVRPHGIGACRLVDRVMMPVGGIPAPESLRTVRSRVPIFLTVVSIRLDA